MLWAGRDGAVGGYLREKGSVVFGLLDAVGHQPLHGLGAAFIQLAEVR